MHVSGHGVHEDRVLDAFQPPPPSRQETDADARLRDALHRRAHEDLPGLSLGAQTRGDVDGPADVALGCLDRLAGVDADPDPERQVRFPCIRLRGGLDDRQSAQRGTRCRREHGVDRVALRLDLGALMASDRPTRDLEESADHVGRRDIPMALRERREAADVGEQESAIRGGRDIGARVIDHVRQMVRPPVGTGTSVESGFVTDSSLRLSCQVVRRHQVVIDSDEIQAVLFDMDGTLVDSDRAVERAWMAWAREFGTDGRAAYELAHGSPSESTVRKLLPHLSEADIRGASARQLELQYEDLSDVVATPGSAALIEILDRRGLPWAVVTSADARLAKARLKTAGITPPILITSDDVPAGKPDPAGYALAAKLLGVLPENCLVVEDAAVGIQAARAAGAHTAALRGLDGDLRLETLPTSRSCSLGALGVGDVSS